MRNLEIYLKTNYQTAAQLAAACSISSEELADLVDQRLIPEPSYTVTAQDVLISQAFGELPAQGATPAQYFHPRNAAWIALALEAKKTLGPHQAHFHLKERFKRNYSIALKELDKTTFRLADSFTDTGNVLPDGLDVRAEAAWGVIS